MNIRTKLVGAFLLVALLVPILGGVAVQRVNRINGEEETVSRGAIPLLTTVHDLEKLQREQQVAVLAYVSAGNLDDRQVYTDRSAEFDRSLAALTAAPSLTAIVAGVQIKDTADRLTAQRTTFGAAAAQLVSSRAAMDRALGELRTKYGEMGQELNRIRARYATSPQDPSSVPASLRNQVNDLLLGTEGMQHMLAEEFALVTSYTVAPDEAARQQFDAAGTAFQNWMALARAAAGPEDRPILAGVQGKFGEFEMSARSMLRAADFVSRSRGAFTQASTSIVGILGGLALQAAAHTDATQRNAEGASSSTGRLLLVMTLVAFALAGAFGIWLAGTLTRPLTHLRDVADRVSRGDLDGVEVDVHTKDEVGDLAHAFRRMVASIRILMPRETEEEEAGTAVARF